MRDRWGRAPLVATLIFIGTLVPALGFFNIYPMRYTYVADHYQYHASAAMLALIAAGLSRLGRGAYVLVLPLLLLCFLRAAIFRDAETLWRDTLETNPNSWMVHLNLGRTLLKNPDQRDEAFHHFERQVQLAPQLPETHWNYGSSLLLRRRYDDALAAYDEAIRLGGAKPLPQAYFGRGMVFMDQSDFASAAAEFQRAIELKPDYHAARQRFAEAMARLRQSSPGAFPSTRP
jgi:tetratricopeptide (TPR) repeat protein